MGLKKLIQWCGIFLTLGYSSAFAALPISETENGVSGATHPQCSFSFVPEMKEEEFMFGIKSLQLPENAHLDDWPTHESHNRIRKVQKTKLNLGRQRFYLYEGIVWWVHGDHWHRRVALKVVFNRRTKQYVWAP